MSIYSTLDLSEMECVILIAKHLGVFEEGRSKQKLLADILFKITDGNEFSPYCFNNYMIDGDPAAS